jgi:hypothetical protein
MMGFWEFVDRNLYVILIICLMGLGVVAGIGIEIANSLGLMLDSQVQPRTSLTDCLLRRLP